MSAFASIARAEPCRGSPAGDAEIQPLNHGATFIGRVIFVGDGRTLCVDAARRNHGLNPRNWVEVRIANSDAPELGAPGGEAAKRRLQRITLGRPVICVANEAGQARVIATCRIRGRDLGAMMRAENLDD